MNRIALLGALGVVLLGSSLAAAEPAGAGGHRVVRKNAEGGATVVSGAAVRGPNGAQGGRVGTTTVNADGSASHHGAMQARGARGSVSSQGSASRDASGNTTQSRTTSVTSVATGNSATTTSSYSKESGRTRATLCFDANGATIACPSRP